MPDQTTDVRSALTQIVAEEAGVEASTLTPASRFTEDLDVDSLGLLTIATQVEERFPVQLDDSLLPTLKTLGALVEHVEAALGAQDQ